MTSTLLNSRPTSESPISIASAPFIFCNCSFSNASKKMPWQSVQRSTSTPAKVICTISEMHFGQTITKLILDRGIKDGNTLQSSFGNHEIRIPNHECRKNSEIQNPKQFLAPVHPPQYLRTSWTPL